MSDSTQIGYRNIFAPPGSHAASVARGVHGRSAQLLSVFAELLSFEANSQMLAVKVEAPLARFRHVLPQCRTLKTLSGSMQTVECISWQFSCH